MGGCKCTFRKCTNASINGFHFFHYPIRDVKRCEKWIINAQKQHFLSLPKEKLRNKVVCEYHFEENCFMNYKHDRLTPFAIPTIDPDGDDGNNINEIQVVPVCRKENPESQMTSTDYVLVAPELNKINLSDIKGDLKLPYDTENQSADSSRNDKDITLIPTSVDKTTFLLSEITELNSFSYNESPINSLNVDSEVREVTPQRSGKKITLKVISNKSNTPVIQHKAQVVNTKVLSNTDSNNLIHLNETGQKIQNLDHIQTMECEEKESVYSVSSTDGNLELVPVNKSSTELHSDIYPLYLTNTSPCESKKQNGENPNKLVYSISINHENQDVILNQIFDVQENQSLSNENVINDINNTNNISEEKYELVDLESVQSFKLNSDIPIMNNQMHIKESSSTMNEISVYEMNNECELSIKPHSGQKEYIKQIKKNAKQIANLKQLFFSYKRRQSRNVSNKYVLSKKKIYRQLRRHINPTLSTIVQMELFNYKQQWTRKEKSMAIEMYSASPEGYSVLTNKWGWKMPPIDLVQKWMKED